MADVCQSMCAVLCWTLSAILVSCCAVSYQPQALVLGGDSQWLSVGALRPSCRGGGHQGLQKGYNMRSRKGGWSVSFNLGSFLLLLMNI